MKHEFYQDFLMKAEYNRQLSLRCHEQITGKKERAFWTFAIHESGIRTAKVQQMCNN